MPRFDTSGTAPRSPQAQHERACVADEVARGGVVRGVHLDVRAAQQRGRRGRRGAPRTHAAASVPVLHLPETNYFHLSVKMYLLTQSIITEPPRANRAGWSREAQKMAPRRLPPPRRRRLGRRRRRRLVA